MIASDQEVGVVEEPLLLLLLLLQTQHSGLAFQILKQHFDQNNFFKRNKKWRLHLAEGGREERLQIGHPHGDPSSPQPPTPVCFVA